jgi:hypothetical protein
MTEADVYFVGTEEKFLGTIHVYETGVNVISDATGFLRRVFSAPKGSIRVLRQLEHNPYYKVVPRQ